MTYYSGPEEVIESHRPSLEVLSGIHYLGADQGLAPLYYQIGIDMFWTALAGYLHGQAVAEANGISAEDFLPHAVRSLDLRYFLEFYAPRITAGDHEGDVDRISMGAASVEHVLRTTEAAGVDDSLPAAVLEIFRRGVAAGHGQRSLTSLVGVLKAGR